MKLTAARFARRCASISSLAAQWASELLDEAEFINREADTESVFRFTDSVRERLDWLDKEAGRQALKGGSE